MRPKNARNVHGGLRTRGVSVPSLRALVPMRGQEAERQGDARHQQRANVHLQSSRLKIHRLDLQCLG